jgi:hypothetical protein
MMRLWPQSGKSGQILFDGRIESKAAEISYLDSAGAELCSYFCALAYIMKLRLIFGASFAVPSISAQPSA